MVSSTHIESFRKAVDFNLDDFIEHQNEREFLFPLHASSVGKKTVWKALVRRLNFMDRASLGVLPSDIQEFVWKSLRDNNKAIQKMQEDGVEARDINQVFANNEATLKSANYYCLAAFIYPKIVLDQRDEDVANGILHVERIKPEDRIAFLFACNDAESAQARLFETFRPGPADDVADRDDREVLGRAPVGPAGHAGAAVFRNDALQPRRESEGLHAVVRADERSTYEGEDSGLR